MADLSFIFDREKRHSDIQIVGGDFLLCDSPQVETTEIDSDGIPNQIIVSGLTGADAVDNGVYPQAGFQGDKPAYIKGGGGEISNAGLGWEFEGNSYDNSHPTSNGFLPDKTGWPVGGGGTAPILEYTIPASTTEKVFNTSSLQVAVELSLFTDRRATLDEIRTFQAGMKGRQSRRGFWSNSFKEHTQGSGLWLLQREKKTNSTLARAQKYCVNSLQWLIDEGVVQSITPTVEFGGDALIIHVAIVKPDGTSDAPFKFQSSWDSLEVS